MGQILLGESESRLYAHMRAKCGRGPTAVSKKVPFNFISRCCSRDIQLLVTGIWPVFASLFVFKKTV